MPNPKMKEILDAVAKASSKVMKMKAPDVSCPHCGGPLDVDSNQKESPMSSQSAGPNRADTDYPSSSGNQPGSSEDR